jgi:multicomponent Na+:H+ antiporter subunit G
VTGILAGAVLGAGAFLLAFAAVGVLVLPDALARQHAATKAGTLALTLVCAGAGGWVGEWGWTLRLLAITVFLLATLPVASHLLARAAVVESGVEEEARSAPLVGGRAREGERHTDR